MTRLAALLLPLVLLAAPCAAQEAVEAEAVEAEAVETEAVEGEQGEASDPEERAVAVFRQGLAAYSDGRFDEAATLFERAYAIFATPVLLYNLARARESHGELEPAIDAYRRFLDAAPEAEDRQGIETRIRVLERQIAERDALAEQASQPPPAPTIERASPSPAPWVITAAGGLTLAASLVTGVLAQTTYDEARAASMVDSIPLEAQANDLATATNVLLIAGGTLALAGLAWGIAEVVLAGAEQPVTPGGQGATARLRSVLAIDARGVGARF